MILPTVCSARRLQLGVLAAILLGSIGPTSVQAQGPIISVSGLDFGALSVGVARGMTVRICNDGSETLTFANPTSDSVLTWAERAFRVSQRDLDGLKSKRLAAGECTTIAVSFLAADPGTYRTVAQIWSNAAAGSSTSEWVARVTQSRPQLTSAEFGDRWLVAASPCSRNPDTAYSASLSLTNIGTAAATVLSVRLDDPSGVFRIDTSNLRSGVSIQPATGGDTPSVALAAYFKPIREESYMASVTITMEDGTAITGGLSGNGWDSHADIEDTVRFGPASVLPGGFARRSLMVRALAGRPMTVTGVRFDPGTEFSLAATSRPLPVRLNPGELVTLDLLFQPAGTGERLGRAIVLGDFSSCDDSVALLVGEGTENAGVGDAVVSDAPLGVTPNPARDQVLISGFGDDAGVVHIELFDPLGRQFPISLSFEEAGRCRVELRGVPAGQYLVRAVWRGGVATRILVVQ